MTFELAFLEDALVQWQRLDGSVKQQPKRKIAEIKRRSVGYRFVYEVRDTELLMLVIAIGKRDRDVVYRASENR